MAKIIDSNIQSQAISNYYSLWRIALIGATLGVMNWLLTAFIGNFVNPLTTAGNVSIIITTTIGIVVMVRLNMIRPLIVALAAAVSLWGLASLVGGLWWVEALAWNILLYMLAYLIFSWLCRYAKVVPVFFSVIMIVILVRIAMAL